MTKGKLVNFVEWDDVVKKITALQVKYMDTLQTTPPSSTDSVRCIAKHDVLAELRDSFADVSMITIDSAAGRVEGV